MFSELAADHIRNRRNVGKLASATHVGQIGTPGEGPFCVLYLEVANGVILRGSYETNGCPTSIASASVLLQLITGRLVEKAVLLNSQDLLRILSPVPEGKEDCPARAIGALNIALNTKQSSG